MMLQQIWINYYLVMMMVVEKMIRVNLDHEMVSIKVVHDIMLDYSQQKKVHLLLIDFDLRHEYTMNDCW
jgi:hypothetical protein